MQILVDNSNEILKILMNSKNAIVQVLLNNRNKRERKTCKL